MALIWYEWGLMGLLFIAILVVFAGITFRFARVRMQKWVGGAIGNFMTNLANQAAEEEGVPGSGAPGSSPGTLNLGGFQIDIASMRAIITMLPEIANFLKTIQGFGFLTGGGGGASAPDTRFQRQ